MLSTVTLSLAIGESRSISAAYAYGLPGERGSRTVRAEVSGSPVTARVGVGRGRGAVVSYVLYVSLPEALYSTIPNARPLDASDGKDRTRGGKREGFADYLFELTKDEYNSLVTTANPETAYVAPADIPANSRVIKTPGIAIPTRYGSEVAEPAPEVTEPEAEAAPEPKPSRRERRRANA